MKVIAPCLRFSLAYRYKSIALFTVLMWWTVGKGGTRKKRQGVRRRSGGRKVPKKQSKNCVTFDLERPQTQILKSDHSLTLNISEMAKGMAITMEG